MDITSIATALSSLTTATDIAKVIRESYDTFDKAKVKLQMAELISKLADAKMEISYIQQGLIGKDVEIRELQKKLKVKKNLKFVKSVYYLFENEQQDGPFCPICYDKDDKLIRLQIIDGTGNPFWKCNGCKNIFKFVEIV